MWKIFDTYGMVYENIIERFQKTHKICERVHSFCYHFKRKKKNPWNSSQVYGFSLKIIFSRRIFKSSNTQHNFHSSNLDFSYPSLLCHYSNFFSPSDSARPIRKMRKSDDFDKHSFWHSTQTYCSRKISQHAINKFLFTILSWTYLDFHFWYEVLYFIVYKVVNYVQWSEFIKSFLKS